MAQSILTRKRDLVYMIFFIIHIPIMFRESLLLSSTYALVDRV